MSIVSISATDVSRITSGQVIVDLTSVVKELVDNAIDAGSDKVEVTFNNHGSTSVEVSDNGCGIDIADFETLCLKHHTSKLSNFEDLTSVSTLGFRGEAMSSMCAVAKVKVATCSASTFPRGTHLEYGPMGQILSKKTSVSGKKGTTVIVTDLFNGIPVRQKNFVKNIKREYSKTLTLLSAYLLAYTNIRFTVFNISGSTGKKSMVMGTQGGKATISDVLTTIYGSNGAYGLIPVDISVENIDARFKLNMSSVPMALSIRVTGVISDCSFGMGRAATDRQYFSINSRPVTHKKVGKIINEVYKSFNTTQTPVYVLDLNVDSSLIDVNVTPDKRSIMMQCEDLICEVIREEITSLYEGRNNLVPKSQVGVVNIGSQTGSSQQRSLDSFRSSQVSFDRSQVSFDKSSVSFDKSSVSFDKSQTSINRSRVEESEEDDEDADETPASSGPTEVTQVYLNSNEDLSNRNYLEPSPEIGEDFEIFHAENVEEDSFKTIKLSEESRSIPAVDDGDHDKVDDFGDIDIDNMGFSSPLRPTVREEPIISSTTQSNPKEIGGIESHALFVSDEIEEIEDGQSRTNSHDHSNDSHDHSNGSDKHSCCDHSSNHEESDDEDFFSSNSHSDNESQEQNDEQIEEATMEPETEQQPNSKKPKRSKMFSGDELQGIQSSLNVRIEDAKAFLTCTVESKKPSDSLASVQDITEAMEICKGDFTKMDIVGQFNSGFIIVTHENKLFIVDQHASDEIYNYERLMSDLTLNPQPLVVPQVLELSPIDEMKILEYSSHLGRNGFSIEEIEDAAPGRRVRLIGIPVSKNVVFDVSDLHELVHKLHEQGASVGGRNTVKQDGSGPVRSALSSCRCTKVDRMIASRACRSSIMIGSALSKQTMSKVVKNLAGLDRPWNCPHGRPTMRHLADIQGTGFSDDYAI
ncbi:hypothetical protein JCM33374_g4379 [Metschnikowia sp. JCM 33374]|nr:hypothetical protein JCM33374_g4379 [Metschnikowia sp. JCM 33374]